MSASLARGASGRRKATALAPHDCLGPKGRRPRAVRLPGGYKAATLMPHDCPGPEGRRPRAARFQEGCRYARQPCAGRFRETKGRRPRAVRLPGAEKPSPSRRALPGRLRACPPALREALPGAERPPPLRRAIARGPEGSRPRVVRLSKGRKAAALAPRASRKVAGMSASLARGASQETEGRRPCAARFPGAERPSPSRRAIVQGPKGRCPCAARFQEGCGRARQPCARRFRETKGRRPRARDCPGPEGAPSSEAPPLRPRFQEAGAAPAASTLRSPPPGTRLPAWEGRE